MLKIVDTKINKNLVDDEIEVSKVTYKSKDLVSTKSLVNKSTKAILLAFMERQEKFNQSISTTLITFIKEQEKFNKEQRKFNKFVMDQFKAHDWIK